MALKTEQLQIRLTRSEKATLKRLARAAGVDLSRYVVSRLIPDEAERFARLARLLASIEERAFAFAEIHDLLVRASPADFAVITTTSPSADLPLWVRNYLAAMVETAAASKGKAPPEWTRAIEPPDEPYFAAPLRSLRPHLLRSSPVIFRRRNLFVDSVIGARV